MMKDIFKKSPRRLRKEKRQRDKEREEQKKELERLRNIYSTKEKKIQNMKRIEKSPKFQNDFKMMKRLLKNDKPMKPIEPKQNRPMKDFMKDYNILNKDDDFMKTKKTKKTGDDFWKL